MNKYNNLGKKGVSLLTAAFTVVSLSGDKNIKDEIKEINSISVESTMPSETIASVEETLPLEFATFVEETLPTEVTTYVEETLPPEIASSVEKTIPEDYPEGLIYINQDGNEFKDYCKTDIVNGEEVLMYKGYNVILAIDMETYDVKEYIYNKGAITDKVYDLSTGYMIVDGSLISVSSDEEVRNWDKITEGNHVFDFAYIDEYLENPEYKEWYTLEEIKELELVIIDTIKTLLNDNSKVK